MPDDTDRTQVTASLGCGTLIIIALIVLFFSGPRLQPLENEIAALRQDVQDLKDEVQTLTEEVRTLREELNQEQNQQSDQPSSLIVTP